jgi:hypothetical protein
MRKVASTGGVLSELSSRLGDRRKHGTRSLGRPTAATVAGVALDRGPLGGLVPKYLNKLGTSAFFELY